MRQSSARKQRTRQVVEESSRLHDSRSQVCSVCFLTFGSSERRVFEGDKVAHLHCARWLSEPKAV